MLTVSDFQILIESCSIESGNDPSPKSEVVHETNKDLLFNTCLLSSVGSASDLLASDGQCCEFKSHWR